MQERSKQNLHPYIWLSAEILLRRVLSEKKLQCLRQQGQHARKWTSKRDPVGKNAELRKERN